MANCQHTVRILLEVGKLIRYLDGSFNDSSMGDTKKYKEKYDDVFGHERKSSISKCAACSSHIDGYCTMISPAKTLFGVNVKTSRPGWCPLMGG